MVHEQVKSKINAGDFFAMSRANCVSVDQHHFQEADDDNIL